MNLEIEEILQNTPFKTYSSLFEAIDNGKAKIMITTGVCRQIAETVKPIYANTGMFRGSLLAILMVMATAVYFSNYFLLLLIGLCLVFPYILYPVALMGKRTEFIPIILVLADLIFLDMPIFITLACICWIMCAISLLWWIRGIRKISMHVIRYNESIFLWAYNSYNLVIEDSYGNTYSKDFEF